jgi:hypothetical protein
MTSFSFFFFRLVFRRSLIPLMLGYSFECRMMYSKSEDPIVQDTLPLVSCAFLRSLPSAESLTFRALLPSNPIHCCASALSLENK